MTKVITIYSKGNMNDCTRFNGNPSNRSRDVSLKTQNFQPHEGEKRNRKHDDSSFGDHKILYQI